MMTNGVDESLQLRMPADLAVVAQLVRRLRAHLVPRGLASEIWIGMQVAVVEAINNAILHGCREKGDAEVVVSVWWRSGELEIEVRDPGRFEPGPDWGEDLPEDPLAEHGRGGFIMRQAFASVSHVNDAAGHAIRLRMPARVELRALGRACECDCAHDEDAELRLAQETVGGLRFLVSLLARSTSLSGLIGPALGRLHEIDPFAFACVRLVRRANLELEQKHGAAPELAQTISLGDNSLEARAVLTLGVQSIDVSDTLPAGDPLYGSGGPVVVVPICFEDERLGTLAVVRARGTEPFGAGMVGLVQTLAGFFGVAWATAQLQARERDLEVTARELTVASEMQTRLLPDSFPAREDVRFSGACRSAQAVGGDFYDVFEVEGGTLVIIADAMGKGVPAAFVASVLRCAIRARARQAEDPGALLSDVNLQIIGDLLAVDIFITALVAFVPSDAREVRLTSAGHCPLMIRRASGSVDLVEGEGLPVGVIGAVTYATVSVPLAPGDAAVFFTDGLYEVGPADTLHLGMEWLRETIGNTRGRDADETVVELLEAVKARAGGGAAGDDRTLLVCERVA